MNDDGGYAFAGSGLQPAFYPTTYWGHETESEGSDGDGAPLPLPPSEPLPEDGDGQPGPASPPLAPPPLAPLIPAREQLYKQYSLDIQSLGLHCRYTEVGVIGVHWDLGSDYYPTAHS